MSHQVENARAFSQKGAAIEIDEKDLSDEVFRKNILGLFNDRSRLDRLAESAKRLSVPEASDNLADTVLALGKR
jgi:UDP-N-acetylglucosamine--N-acetylmuramyl-(pentapeptide) pyrophosphoryl-undecaprenol N-acetylglucosamine transferase